MKLTNRRLLRLAFKVLSECNALVELLWINFRLCRGFIRMNRVKTIRYWFLLLFIAGNYQKLGTIIGNGYKNSGFVEIYSLRQRKNVIYNGEGNKSKENRRIYCFFETAYFLIHKHGDS